MCCAIYRKDANRKVPEKQSDSSGSENKKRLLKSWILQTDLKDGH